MPSPPPEWIAPYFDRLFERRFTARPVEQRHLAFADGALPQPNQCHDNAQRLAQEHPHLHVVRGWLIVSASEYGLLALAHSILRDIDGTLFDITPMPPEGAPGFLEQDGDEEQFSLLRVRWASTCWPPLPIDYCASGALDPWPSQDAPPALGFNPPLW
jgi:hypothetical protein